jgi:hypothetical protein
MIVRRDDMKRIVLGATTLALLSGLALAAPAQAATYKHASGGHYGAITPHERAVIARSQHQVGLVKAHARADGHVTPWERARIRAAEARHAALVFRLSHN